MAGLDLYVPADYKHFEDNKKPEFLAKFPHGKIPALETTDGFRIFEGAAIARYGQFHATLSEMRSEQVVYVDTYFLFFRFCFLLSS